ncbi:hypothetical protein H0H87_011710 [Tephrocybe sp. NHM501043]|nr:hypothetical protein H0H87_011710 [Tephrocybe sp. NHM501043]
MPMLTRRNRRARARVADMQLDSDVDMEPEPELQPARRTGRREVVIEDQDDGEGSNVDIEAVAEGDEDDGPEEEEEDEEDEEDEEEDEDDEIQSDADEPPKVSGSRLKIRLKMPAQALSRYETPLVESEDSMDSMPTNTRLTTRQAVLASVMDSSHVSLGSGRQKKAPLNETELALRREETARKRRNMTEKKLEDEKAETINRLLKKQSRPRKKRGTAQRTDMDDVVLDTRSNSNSVYNPSNTPTTKPKKPRKAAAAAGDEDGEEEDGDDEEGLDDAGDDAEDETPPEREREPTKVPTMYRWVSTSRIPGAAEGKEDVATMQITFSVPVSAIPAPFPEIPPPVQVVPRPTTCAAPGCGKPFRYRLVSDWTRGACGIACLKALEPVADKDQDAQMDVS